MLSAARDAGCEDLVLLKCTSTYPASPENSNLLTITHMRELFALGGGQPIGARAVIGLVLAHPDPQRLWVDAQIACDLRDRTLGLSGDSDGALSELG